MMKSYEAMAEGFRKYHSRSGNVAAHLLTTPLCLVATLSLLATHCGTDSVWVVSATYCVALFPFLPSKVYLLNTVATICLVLMACTPTIHLAFTTLGWAGVFAVGYVGQDLAHYFADEPTFQSSYISNSGGLYLLMEHTFFLLPLCIDATFYMSEPFTSWFVAHQEVCDTKLTSVEEQRCMATIRDFIRDSKPATSHTTHIWYSALTGNVKDAFDSLAGCKGISDMFENLFNSEWYNVEIITEMNEIYVASTNYKNNSDRVFFMKHVDGPYFVWPFCRVYRCMLALNPNRQITTEFPMARQEFTLSEGDVVGFDFNRELHVIKSQPTKNTDFRMAMKLHYVVYPKSFGWFGRLLGNLTAKYDVRARNLFVYTLVPKSIMQHAASWYVIVCTKLAALTCEFVGFNNAVYLIMLACLSYWLECYLLFLIGTSYMHYCIYIGTFYQRVGVSYGSFQRDVVLYKGLALCQLLYQYVRAFDFQDPDYVSLGLIVAGFTLSTMAASALGWDRTYFGAELGFCAPERINKFPYGPPGKSIPHPMIVGGITWLVGMHKLAAFRTAWPYLVPVHALFYITHCLQEEAGIHSGVHCQPYRGDLMHKNTDASRDVDVTWANKSGDFGAPFSAGLVLLSLLVPWGCLRL